MKQNHTKPNVEILLGTYNGEKYIKSQIESILNQTYNNWSLVIRDDGSKDRTTEIIEEFRSEFPDKIKILGTENKNLGVVRNFKMLLEQSTENYVMLCDQDDIWLPKKIEITLEEMHLTETNFGKNHPILVHTDLELVNQDLEPYGITYWKKHRINSKSHSLNYLLLENSVTGCTVMANRCLLNKALPLPITSKMHDWWLALVAASVGKIVSIPTATILYRQHEKNVAGATKENLIQNTVKFMREGLKSETYLIQQLTQAINLNFALSNSISQNKKDIISDFTKMINSGFPYSWISVMKNNFFWREKRRTIFMILALFKTRKLQHNKPV